MSAARTCDAVDLCLTSRQVMDDAVAGRASGSPNATARSGTSGLLSHVFRLDDEADREELERKLRDRLSIRIAASRKKLIEERFQLAFPKFHEEFASYIHDTTTDAAVLDEVGVSGVVMLLNEAGRTSMSMADACVLLQEAVIDTVFPGSEPSPGLMQVEQLCRRAAMDQIRHAIEVMSRNDDERRILCEALYAEAPAADPPAQASDRLFLDAVRRGDHRSALELLATAALVPLPVVEAAVLQRNRRGLVSLAWRAGFTMQSAVLLQSQIAGVPPHSVLGEVENGAGPLGRSEMVWQIALMSQSAS